MFQALESISNLSEGYSRCFTVDGQKLLLVHSGDETRLIPIQCPHEGYSLKKASLQNGEICCPKHGISFRLDNGQAMGGEVMANVAPLQPIKLTEKDGVIGVEID